MLIDRSSFTELYHDTLGVEAAEGWLLPDFDCPCDWAPGCMAPKPEGCTHWPGVEE